MRDEVIDYLELVKDDGTVIRFYVNPDELLSDYSYYFGNKKYILIEIQNKLK